MIKREKSNFISQELEALLRSLKKLKLVRCLISQEAGFLDQARSENIVPLAVKFQPKNLPGIPGNIYESN